MRERIEEAKKKGGVEEVILVAATKTVEPARIREAISCGIRDIGENRVQEARKKIEILGRENIRWYMIGHLQKNKVKYAIKMFDMIQSLDSLPLAEELERRLAKERKKMPVLVEVNIGRESTKFGIFPEKLKEFIHALREYPHLECRGLMCIPPWSENPENTRPYFARMRELMEEIKKENFPHVKMEILSMGMSDDFEVAIEEGANMVRLGRIIFGERKEGK